MLNTYLTMQTPITVTLQNKIRVSGKIKAFDGYVIIMEGQKREILYRHAISTLCLAVQAEPKRQTAERPVAVKPAIASNPKPHKSSAHKTQQMHQQPSLSASTSEPINSSMKDGLLKWMREQKAAK